MSTSRRSSRIAIGTSKNPPKDPNSPRRPRSKKPPLKPPRTRAKKPPPRRMTGPPELLYLRIHRSFLNLIPVTTADQPNPQPLPPLPGATGHLIVIRASLQDLHPFAGVTVDWLIRVARLIFEPLGTSSLFTFTEDTLESWLDRDMDPTWKQVEQGEPLRATIYEFRPDNSNASITLSKMSLRQGQSATANASQPQTTAFRDTIRARDRECIITQNPHYRLVTASRLLPKRLGDVAITAAVQRFTGSNAAVTRFDPTIGVLLSKLLDALVDNYEMGFWNSGPDQYVVHNFFPDVLNIDCRRATGNDSLLHGHMVPYPTDDAAFPAIGIFNWHYLQCVLTRFATEEFRQIQNITYFSFPFRTREEEEDDEGDFDFDDERNIANPPYPSYPIELAEVRARQHLEDAERNRDIAVWNSTVSLI